MTSEGMTPADISAVLGNNRNDGMFGDNGAWWLIILFLFAFCGGWGNGGFGGSQGAANNYTLASDFATIQRQLSDGFNAQERRTDAIVNGICDLGYTQQSLSNATNMNVLQGFNATQAQLAQCCCDIREGISGVNYNMAMNANGIQNAMQTGFCQTNYNASNNTRDIVDSQNASTRAILDKLCQMESNAKDEKIAELQAKNADLRLAASQQAQNAYLIDQLGYHCPQPAYVVQPPQTVSFQTGCNGVATFGGCNC